MRSQQDPAEPVQANAAALALQHRLAHGQARIVGGMVGKTVAVEDSPEPAVISADDHAGILARDIRIEAPQVGIDFIRPPEQEAEDIQKMDSRLVNQKAFHLLEIGLSFEIGLRPLPVSRPQREAELVKPAEPLCRDQLLQGAVPWLEPEILVNGERHARIGGKLGDPPRLVERAAKGFLADDARHAVPDGGLDQRRMRVGRRYDIEDVGRAFCQHRFEAVKAWYAVRAGSCAVGIGDPGQGCSPGLEPGAVVQLCEVARARAGDAKGGRFHPFSDMAK